jgi:hypothetical protein
MLHRTGLFESTFESANIDANEILVGDLPLVFDPHHGPRPAPLPLKPGAEALERVSDRLRAAGPPPWIALTWRAGMRDLGLYDRLFKEVPLAALGEALRGVRATWIGVQRSPAPGEREAIEGSLGAPVHDFSSINDDLEDALAVMALMDDYVGVSNTNLHLRASLNRGARVLVAFPPEWRWGFEGVSPWFPEMSAYRAAPGGDWSAALAALRRDMLP